jgi:hypothetical protein
MAELSVGTIPTTVTALLIVALTALLLIYRRRHPYLSRQYAKFRVISKRTVSQNAERPVVFIAFGVSTASLPTGQHVQVRAVIDGEEVERPYTPARFEPPECELLLRVYPDGKMSRYLYSLDVGDYAELRGPIGHIRYGDGGPGTFSRGSKRKFTGVTHVAATLSAHANALAIDPPRSFASEHEDAWLLKHVAGWAIKRRGTFVVPSSSPSFCARSESNARAGIGTDDALCGRLRCPLPLISPFSSISSEDSPASEMSSSSSIRVPAQQNQNQIKMIYNH